jgi:hypothetical protein
MPENFEMKPERLSPEQFVLGVHWSGVPLGSTVHPFGHCCWTDHAPLLQARRSLEVVEMPRTQACWPAYVCATESQYAPLPE